MKRVLMTGALLALAAAPATAADIKIYGQAHLALSYLDNGGDYSAANVSSNSSYIGVRGSHDLSPELRALVQAEGSVDFNEPNDKFSFSNFDTFLGLAGDWGMLRVGHINTPMKTLSRRVELFPNQLGDSRNVMAGAFDERFDNSIFYTSPSFAGITANLQYSVESGEDNNTAVDGNKNDAWSVSLTYQQGPIYAAIAHEQWNSETPNSDRNATRLAAYYDIANIRITGLVHIASYDASADANTYGLGLRYALTPQIALKAQYYMLDSDASNADANLIAVGADYQYTKALRFYLNYAQVANDANTDRVPWNSASTLSTPRAMDETARGVALGAIFNF